MSLRIILRTTVACAALVGAAACGDEKVEPVGPAPTEAPVAAASAASADLGKVMSGSSSASSVCRGYQRKADKVKAAQEKDPKDEKLKAQAKALAEIVKDACN